jgi:hypothetical protein
MPRREQGFDEPRDEPCTRHGVRDESCGQWPRLTTSDSALRTSHSAHSATRLQTLDPFRSHFADACRSLGATDDRPRPAAPSRDRVRGCAHPRRQAGSLPYEPTHASLPPGSSVRHGGGQPFLLRHRGRSLAFAGSTYGPQKILRALGIFPCKKSCGGAAKGVFERGEGVFGAHPKKVPFF